MGKQELAIAINTAPRTDPSLYRSIESLREAGFTQKVVIIADCPIEPIENTEVIQNDPPKGALANLFFTMDTMLERDWDWLAILEDDIIWAKNSAKALAKDLEKLEKKNNVGLLSVFIEPAVGREMKIQKKTADGLHIVNLKYRGMGSQAYILPRKAVELLTSDPKLREWPRNQNRDNVTCGRLNDLGLDTWYRMPGLVNHSLGSGNSSIKEKRPRDTKHWRPVA